MGKKDVKKGAKPEAEKPGAKRLRKDEEEEKEKAAPPKKKNKNDIDAIFNAAKKAKAIAEAEDDEEEAGASGREEEEEDGEVDASLMKELAEKIKKSRKSDKKAKEKPEAVEKVKGSKDDLFGSGPQIGRRRTDEGFALFKETEFQNKKNAGTTPDCPFDCDCCYI